MSSKIIKISEHKRTKFANFRIRTNQSRPKPTNRFAELNEARNAFERHVKALTLDEMIPIIIDKIVAEVESDGRKATTGNVYRATGRRVKTALCAPH